MLLCFDCGAAGGEDACPAVFVPQVMQNESLEALQAQLPIDGLLTGWLAGGC